MPVCHVNYTNIIFRVSGNAVIAYPRVTELTRQGELMKQFGIAIWSQDLLLMSVIGD